MISIRDRRAAPGSSPATRAFRAPTGGLLLLGLLIGGWGPGGRPAAADEEAPAAASGAGDPARLAPEGDARAGDDPSVIDCLLPADITRLGGQIPHIGPRRLVQVPAAECRDRGGEEVAPGAGPADAAPPR